MWIWIKRHWKTAASIGCTIVAAGAIPINPLITVAVGSVCTAVLSNKAK